MIIGFVLRANQTSISQGRNNMGKFFGGNQVYGRQKVHDFRKKQFAEKNSYPLLVVKCVNTTIDDVCNDVLKFLSLRG